MNLFRFKHVLININELLIKPGIMEEIKKKLSSTFTCILLSTVIVLSNDPPKKTAKKEIEKIEIKVNGKTHIVHVNKTMIDKLKNVQYNDSCSSAILFLPIGYPKEIIYTNNDAYIVSVKKETKTPPPENNNRN